MRKLFLLLAAGCCFAGTGAQKTYTFSNPDLVPVKLERISKQVRDVTETKPNLKLAPVEHENESLEKHMPFVNPNALPQGADEALQHRYNQGNYRSTNTVTVNVLNNLSGLSASVNPSDNNIAVSNNYVVQMSNNSSSTYMRIWDKAGNVLSGNVVVSSFSGISDYGDPNIIYDQQADRFVFVLLYSKNAKKLEVCVSKTNDPRGSWYVYSFTTANGFPDYPKLGVWGNSYLITTNSSAPSIYVLNRTSMLAGSGIGTAQVFSLSKFSALNFQSASPVSQTGATPPPAGVPASVIRVADDAWSTTLGPDHLELFNLAINWTTPSSSTITGPVKLNTIAYNSNLCGISSSSCIPQPGTTTKLDPLSDIIMDKVQYRNFGTYEAMVCSHVCNADGNGTAGIRWYELRRNQSTGAWYIYQQSTYAPNTTNRFMSSITLNDKGTIALGYNVSSSSVYPGICITGRDSCDALNNMTVAETATTTGTASNGSTRYGDYNGMVTDPADGSFWFTAQYNSGSTWSTKVVHFAFSDCPVPAFKTDETAGINETEGAAVEKLQIVPNPAATEVLVSFITGNETEATIQIFDMNGRLALEQHQSLSGLANNIRLNTAMLTNGNYLLRVVTPAGSASKRLVIQK
jgi:hypothetical protein